MDLMSKSKKVYDHEFKLNAVRLIQAEEGSQAWNGARHLKMKYINNIIN